jgi:type II secretory pathway component GspD/PulD (secretin)
MKTMKNALMIAGLACLAATGFAQNTPVVAEAKPVAPPDVSGAGAKPAEGTAGKPTAGAPVKTGEVVPLIVIDDVPLLDAIKNLARQSGINFQFDPRVTVMSNQPNVTVRFENVTAEDALGAVLDNYGMVQQHDPKAHISKITIKDPKAEEPLVSRVIQLQYSSPSNLVILLKATLSPRSQLLADARTSQILVMTTEKELANLEALVQKLDTPTAQVLIEAQLWETSKKPSSVKGIDWSGTLGAQRVTFGNGNTTGTIEQRNTFTQSGSASVTRPGGAVEDPGGRSIPTESSTKSEATKSSGSGIDSILKSVVGGSGIGLNTARGFNPATAFLNADGLSAVVSFLNQDSDTELVATPRAVTLDNQTAYLNVSRAYPVYKITPGSANSPAGSEITWTNVGVILSVTPRVAGSNNISLQVTPELSDIADVDKQVINGQPYTANIYGIRRVDTKVMIKSGATLVLGGLINDRAFKSYTKVPILGDAPIFGLLFRKDEKKRDKSNLMIFITPTIVEENDLQVNKPSNFLKSQYQPEQLDKPVTAWDSGAPYDWTKLGTNAPSSAPKTADSKTGKL